MHIKREKTTSWPTELAQVKPRQEAQVAEPVKKPVKNPVKPVKRSRIKEMIEAPIIREPLRFEKAKEDYSSGYFGLSPEDRKKLREEFGENIKIAESRD